MFIWWHDRYVRACNDETRMCVQGQDERMLCNDSTRTCVQCQDGNVRTVTRMRTRVPYRSTEKLFLKPEKNS